MNDREWPTDQAADAQPAGPAPGVLQRLCQHLAAGWEMVHSRMRGLFKVISRPARPLVDPLPTVEAVLAEAECILHERYVR
ncbi:MAG TPA: hypothetical protein VKV26_24045 [Dehalococcoidia bacterium]|nr:hypothetical protein [Dehalococcoidia bacterium]